MEFKELEAVFNFAIMNSGSMLFIPFSGLNITVEKAEQYLSQYLPHLDQNTKNIDKRILISSLVESNIESFFLLVGLFFMVPISGIMLKSYFIEQRSPGYFIPTFISALLFRSYFKNRSSANKHFTATINFENTPENTRACTGSILFRRDPSKHKTIILHLRYEREVGGDHRDWNVIIIYETKLVVSPELLIKGEEGWKTNFSFIDLPQLTGGYWAIAIQCDAVGAWSKVRN